MTHTPEHTTLILQIQGQSQLERVSKGVFTLTDNRRSVICVCKCKHILREVFMALVFCVPLIVQQFSLPIGFLFLRKLCFDCLSRDVLHCVSSCLFKSFRVYNFVTFRGYCSPTTETDTSLLRLAAFVFVLAKSVAAHSLSRRWTVSLFCFK